MVIEGISLTSPWVPRDELNQLIFTDDGRWIELLCCCEIKRQMIGYWIRHIFSCIAANFSELLWGPRVWNENGLLMDSTRYLIPFLLTCTTGKFMVNDGNFKIEGAFRKSAMTRILLVKFLNEDKRNVGNVFRFTIFR